MGLKRHHTLGQVIELVAHGVIARSGARLNMHIFTPPRRRTFPLAGRVPARKF
jgi:hypothetical protein